MMNKPLFEIGDRVYLGSFNRVERWVQCPDCFGKKFLTVILGDDSRVTIDCDTCNSRGSGTYSTGVVRVEDREPTVDGATVIGVERREQLDAKDGEQRYTYEYRTTRGIVTEDRIATSEFGARSFANMLVADMKQREEAASRTKERPTRNWAWHVTYHRRGIKEAKRQFDYHVSRLEVAKEKAKEDGKR